MALKHDKVLFTIGLPDTLIPSEEKLKELNALEDVVMVGYPIGLSDMANNFPIVRKGITASHPSTDFNAKPEGVADIAAFPGSSGSPILIVNQGSYGMGAKGIAIGSRTFLLGVLFAGPQFKADGTIEIKEIPTGKIAVPSTAIPIHLGYYVKAKELNVLKDHLMKTLGIH